MLFARRYYNHREHYLERLLEGNAFTWTVLILCIVAVVGIWAVKIWHENKNLQRY